MYNLDAPGTSTNGSTTSQFGEYRGFLQSCIPLQSETINNKPNTETTSSTGATTQNESSQFGVYLSMLNIAPHSNPSSLFIPTQESKNDANEANKVDENKNSGNLLSFGQPPVVPHPPPPPPQQPSIFAPHPPPPPSIFGGHPPPPPPPPQQPSIFAPHPPPPPSIFGGHPPPPPPQQPSIFAPHRPQLPRFGATTTTTPTDQQTSLIQKRPPPPPPLPPGGFFGTTKSTGTSLFCNSTNTPIRASAFSFGTKAPTATTTAGFGASQQNHNNGPFGSTKVSSGFSFGPTPQQHNNNSLFGTQPSRLFETNHATTNNQGFGPTRSIGFDSFVTAPPANFQTTSDPFGCKKPRTVFVAEHMLTNANYLANYEYTDHDELFMQMAQLIHTQTLLKPVIAIICDSNLSSLSNKLRNRVEIPYQTIPFFLNDNKNGKFVFGTIKDVHVVCMACRFNASDKYTSAACTMPIRLFKYLGVKIIITTGVCESISKFNEVGDVLIVKDHASLPLSNLQNPLIGVKDADKLNVNAIYSKDIREIFKTVGKYDGIYFNECVYGGSGGPTSETIAGVKLMQLCGANVIGFNDIINEAIVSAYCKIKVLGLVVVTNIAISEYDSDQKKNYDEISNIANEKVDQIGELISKFIGKLDDDKLL